MDVGWTAVDYEVLASAIGQAWTLESSSSRRMEHQVEQEDVSLDKSSLIFLVGMIMIMVTFSLLKFCCCEGPLVRRHEKRVREERKQYIRDCVAFKVVKLESESTTMEKSQGESKDDDDDEEEEIDINVVREKVMTEQTVDLRFLESQRRSTIAIDSGSADAVDEDTIEQAPSSQEEGPECQICLDEFKAGDTICWSHNPKCIHVFHFDCLERWLMKHDGCPLCRQKYLVP